MPSQKNITQVNLLVEKLQSTPHFAIVSFGKATHKAMEELRAKLRTTVPSATETPLHVLKNSLLGVALKKIQKSQLGDGGMLAGATALLSLPADWTELLKAFYTASKSNDNFSFKAGVIDGKMYKKDELVRLAQLPGRDELVVKIITSLKTPQTRLVRSLNFNMQKLVYVLQSKAKVN